MKFYKFKQVQRLVFFGYDDILRTDSGSVSKKSKQSTTSSNDTKRLKFNFIGKNGEQLSPNAKIVIESLYLPVVASADRKGPVTLRVNNLHGDTFDSQDNNLNSPLLFCTETPGSFQNNDPKMLYNFNISQSFFTNGYLELEITYPNINVLLDSLISFYISLIIYDVNEEELILKDTQEVDTKDMRSHVPSNFGDLGIVPTTYSRYKTSTKNKIKV